MPVEQAAAGDREYAALQYDDEFVVYQRDQEQAWLQSDTVVEVRQ